MNTEILKAIILGVVQGITEFLPVSSTAHLILFPWFFGWDGEVNTLAFDVALHGGTLASLLVCFYRDWLEMFSKNRRMLFYIVVATIPAGTAGLLLHGIIEGALRSPLVITFSLIVFGILMLAAERYSAGKKLKELNLPLPPFSKEGHGRVADPSLSLMDSIIIGAAQAVALIPGVSRSGITITAGLFRNLKRESAARFSFLLSTPVIGGAALMEGLKLYKNPGAYDLQIFSAGFAAAFVSGFFAIRFLLAFLKKYPLNIFVYYRFALAVIILGVWLK